MSQNLKIPSHLLLTQRQREQLNSLSASEFTDLEWTTQSDATSFLLKYNLLLEEIHPEHKWKIRYSNKVKGIYILQCCCGSDMSLKKSKSGEEVKTRKTRQMYNFVGCLAFARIKKYQGSYFSIFGYLNHLEDCQRCLPNQPPPLRINETVKLMVQNLLQTHANTSYILDDNMDFIVKNLNGKIIINEERYLLSNQDIINIRNSTKDLWGIDKRKAT